LTTIAHIYKKVFFTGITRKLSRLFALLVLLLPIGLWIAVASPLKNGLLKKSLPVKKIGHPPAPHKQLKLKENNFLGGQILTCSIPEEIAPADINQTTHVVGITVHATQDRTHLTPTITVTAGSTISPASGVPNDFTNAPLYTVDPGIGETNYNIQVLPAHTATTCSGYPKIITGDSSIPAATYEWQILSDGSWSPAPGANTGQDYTTPGYTNTTTSLDVYTFRRQITVPAVGVTYDSYYDLSVQPSTDVTGYNINPPAITTFCGSGTPTFTGNTLAGGLGPGSYAFTWQSSTDGLHYTTIPGANGPDYTPSTPVTTTTWFQRIVFSVGSCSLAQFSNPVKITIEPPLGTNTITTTGTTTFCGSGDPASITGNAVTGGDGTPVYKWESSPDNLTFTAIPGAAGTAFQNYDPPPITGTTYYHRIVTSGSCSTGSISASVKITIEPALSANTITPTGATTFCQTGDPTVIHGLPVTGGDGTPVYQWESSTDGTNFAPANGSANFQDYEPPVITVTTYYRRRVTSGSCSTPVYSTPIKYTIEPPISNNTIAATGATAFCVSGTPVITGSLPTGGDGVNYVYTWDFSTDGGANFNPVPGAAGQSYTPSTPITVTTMYRRTVSSGSCTPGTTSTAITFTVTPAITSNTTHTSVTEFCLSTGTFTITGDPPAGGDGTYTYQWQSSTDGVNYSNISSNSTSISYTSPSLTAPTWFKRLVSSGACNNTSESTPIKITVYQAFAGNTLTPPPVNKFCGSGDAGPITGSVPTGGDGHPQYQWQQSPDNVDAHFTIIFGANGKDFDPPSLTSTMFYRRVVTGPVCTTPDVSAAVEIHITPPIVPGSNNILVPPFPYCVSVDPQPISGSFVQGGDPGDIQYKWYVSTDGGANWNLIPGADQIDYDPPTITVTTSYRRDVTSGACQTPVPSNVATITVNQTPANVTVGAVAPVCAGSTVTMSVTSPDPALTYTWYDSQSRNHVLYQGTSYTTDPLTTSTTFYVDATNGSCNSPVLTAVPVTVNALPEAPALDGAPYTGCTGSGATLKVLNPQGGLTYKWYTVATGGTAELTGATVTTPVLNDNAIYYVEAVNTSTGCISATRSEADIAVFQLPVAVAHGADICPGTTAVLTANSEDQDQQVKWYATATDNNALWTGSTFTTPTLTSNTTYYVEVTNTVSGCVSATRAVAEVRMIVPLSAPIVQVQNSFAPTVTFQWAPVTGATGYLVSTDNGVTFTDPSSGSDGFTHSFGGLQAGQKVTLIVRALGVNDCETSANSAPVTATAINSNVDEIFVANAFTPNGDGRNDIVYVRNENIKSLKFYVYSQYGQLLYASQSQQNGWDGTFKGKAQPAGVYVYYLEAVMNDGSLQNKRGTITLIR